MTEREEWHLDKRVPVSLILALVFQTVTVTAFLTNMSDRIGVLESEQLTSNSVNATVIRMGTQLDYIEINVREMKETQRRNTDVVRDAYRKGEIDVVRKENSYPERP